VINIFSMSSGYHGFTSQPEVGNWTEGFSSSSRTLQENTSITKSYDGKEPYLRS
jgi:hypothetical protein